MIGRIFLPVLSLVLLALYFMGVFHPPLYSLGSIKRESGGPVLRHVGPALAAQGVSEGDRLVPSAMSMADRLRLRFGVPQGTAMHVVVQHDGALKAVAAPADVPFTGKDAPTGHENGALRWLALITVTISLLLAAYVSALRPGPMMAALILFLGGGAIDYYWIPGTVGTFPDWLFVAIVAPTAVISGVLPTLQLAAFAIRFPNLQVPPHKLLYVRIVDAVVLLGVILEVLRWSSLLQMPPWYVTAYSIASVCMVVAACVVSLITAERNEVGRVAIVFIAIVVGGIGYGVSTIAETLLGISSNLSDWITLVVVLVPIAVNYAILRHRVVDIGFFLNRTIVYAITSAVVLVMLAATEFLAEHFIKEQTHAESIAVEFGIAMFVIIAARFVHGWIDKAVDKVIFSVRHTQEQALREFAVTAQFYTETEPLIADTIEALEKYARVEGVAVYLVEGDILTVAASTFKSPKIDVLSNDKAFVALRAHRDEIDIGTMQTAMHGVRMYPMVLGGRVLGALTTGERESHEAMPPDIDEAIQRIAGSVTIGLAAIENARMRADFAKVAHHLKDFSGPRSTLQVPS